MGGNMIKDLEVMEKIVAKSNSLSWEGWNVVELIPSATAMFKTNGAFVNGNWYLKNVYQCGTQGWKIPNKYVR
jgi:hypothetical protein